jgi:hypothetical protein
MTARTTMTIQRRLMLTPFASSRHHTQPCLADEEPDEDMFAGLTGREPGRAPSIEAAALGDGEWEVAQGLDVRIATGDIDAEPITKADALAFMDDDGAAPDRWDRD